MRSFRIVRRRSTKLVCIAIVSLSCAIVSMDGPKAKTLDYECSHGVWTNDGTPFEEPELNVDATCLTNHCDGKQRDCDQSTDVTNSVRSAASEVKTSPLRTRIVSLLFRLGWLR
jgi:hypothetical protein